MSVLSNKTSWNLYEIQDLILEHKTPENIWVLFNGGIPLHPVIRDLIERGICLRSKDIKFREREMEYLKRKQPREYARRVNIESKYVSSVHTAEAEIFNRHCGKLKVIIDEYATSVLSKFIFGGMELGMMTRDDVNREYTLRHSRSEKEFKQSMFLAEIYDKIRDGQLVKDCISPVEANNMWDNIEQSSVMLAGVYQDAAE